MPELRSGQGGYAFLPGDAVFSLGVVALPGHAITRAALATPIPVQDAFRWVTDYLAAIGRPRAALCGVELRLPRPLSFVEFAEMNAGYMAELSRFDLLQEGLSPITRTTVAQGLAPPTTPIVSAFTFTTPSDSGRAAFVTAGNGELRSPGQGSIVRPGDVSYDAIHDKAVYVVGQLDRTIRGLAVTWKDATDLTVYATAPWQHVADGPIASVAGAQALDVLRWVYATPPIAEMSFEMDVRGVAQEWRLP